jgi:hypothetical protein
MKIFGSEPGRGKPIHAGLASAGLADMAVD